MTDTLFGLADKVAIVTGGAGGIGRAIAIAFAERGADVIVTSRNLNKLEAVAREIVKLGRKALAISCNVTEEKSVIAMVERVVKEFSRVDILVNAAGEALRKSALETTAEDWRHIVELNSLGTFICCREVAKVMMKQNGGKIVNLSSIRGRFGVANFGAAYCPSKGAIDSLTRTLACEWAPHHIYVNALAPAVIKTELTASMFADPERAKMMGSQFPLGRIGELSDVVGPAVFLASSASSFVTGQVIYIDGGGSAGQPGARRG